MKLPKAIQPLTPGHWQREAIVDRFAQNCEPIYRIDLAEPGEPLRFGFLVEDRHCNRIDSCHGGMLATFLDFALGTIGKTACGDDIPTPTISLSIDYLQPAFSGEWVETRSRLVHSTRGMFFIEGSAVTRNGAVARANAIFKRFAKTSK